MKKRLIAIVASVFAAILLWSSASAVPQAGGSGNDWESHTSMAGGAGNDWEFSPASSSRGNDWE